MPLYKYTAVDDRGRKRTGTIYANNEQDLVEKLSSEGCYLVSAEKRPLLDDLEKKYSTVKEKYNKEIIFFKCPECSTVQAAEIEEFLNIYPRIELLLKMWLEKGYQCSCCSINIPLNVLKLADGIGWCYECDRSEKIIKIEIGFFDWLTRRSTKPKCSKCGENLQSWALLGEQGLIDKIVANFNLVVQELDPTHRFISSTDGFWFQLPSRIYEFLFRTSLINSLSFVLRIIVTNEWHLQHYQMRLQAAQAMYSTWRACVLKEFPGFAELVRKRYYTELGPPITAFSIQDFGGNEVGGMNSLLSAALLHSEVWVQKDSGLLSQGL